MNHHQTIRHLMRQRRLQLTSEQHQRHADQVITHIRQQTDWLQTKQTIACYYHTQGELKTEPLWQTLWQQSIDCFLPVLSSSKTLLFAPFTATTPLVKNQYNIAEPTTPTVSAQVIDLIFLPLLAFDNQGNRLGQGQGYYDRTLAFKSNTRHNKPYLVGLAHSFQAMTKLEPQAWDIPLDAIVTEKAVHIVRE